MSDNKKAQNNIDHLATILLNVVRMNKPWRKDDLTQLSEYVRNSSMDKTLKRVVLDAIAEAMPLGNDVEVPVLQTPNS